jgi:hypothetical protein
MGATVKLEQVGKKRWRVSIIRAGKPSSVVEADHDHTMRIAWRAASLIPFWDTSAPAAERVDFSRIAHRYVIVDPTAPRATRSRYRDAEGAVMSSFGSLELAEAFARDEIQYGNPNVVVIDRKTGKRVYP